MKERLKIEPGIYFGLPEEAYHAAEGLSCSGMKHLSVSPLNYWHNNLNPEREDKHETAAQRFGKAAHCLGLEPERFSSRYALRLSLDDVPGALVTTDDMKAWLERNGLPKTAKKKQELVDRILSSGIPAVIWDLELQKHAELNEGKTLLGPEESKLVQKAASVLSADPFAKAILTGGVPEVSMFAIDPETGILLKARMDYVRPDATIDLKTFSNSRGKPTDRVVYDAIYYEGYHLQCCFYQKVRELARRQLADGLIETHGCVPEAWLKAFTENDRHGFAFVFIESDEPFDLRIIQLRQNEAAGADPNVYWLDADMKIEEFTKLYAECREKYGDEPWREYRQPHVLEDADIPQLLFAGR